MAHAIDWERAAAGWGRTADRLRAHGMPVSMWMLDSAALQPGERVLELAAGPGDTGFLAAELVEPGGRLICSDSAPAMLGIAKQRAAAQGITNVEFMELTMEWLDLPTASVDVILCRWGLMLSADPAGALQEWRRVLAPGGRLALAVWDAPDANPWTTIPADVLAALRFTEPPDRGGPGMFALADAGRLDALLADAGFVERTVQPVTLERAYESVDAWIAETAEVSASFGAAFRPLSVAQRAHAVREIRRAAAPFTADGGSVRLPGRTLAALAHA